LIILADFSSSGNPGTIIPEEATMGQPPSQRVRQYDQMEKYFDARMGLYARQTITEAVTLAKLSGTEAILDACSGTGELLQLIALNGHTGSLVGVDYSQEMLNVAMTRLRQYPNITLKLGPTEHLKFPDRHFEVVFTTNALHYLEHPLEAFEEYRRVLRSHGRLIVADLAANSRLTRLWSSFRRFFGPAHHVHLYRAEEVIDLLRASGFVIVRKKIWRVNLFWSVMLFEAQNPAPTVKKP